MGQSRMDNPKKLATLEQRTQDEDRKKTTTHYIMDTTMRKQIQITY